MPWWSGAVFNFIPRVQDDYIILKARVVSGLLLDKWSHDFVNVDKQPELLDPEYWKIADFTLFVFCPFDTTKGGSPYVDGTMTFADFYPSECSPDGRLCSFLSRSKTKLFRESVKKPDKNKIEKQAIRYFKGIFFHEW